MLTDFDAIVYHEGCPDGITSLWTAMHFKPIPEIVPCRAGCSPSGDFTNKNVLFVDICPKRDYLEQLSCSAKNIVILDHHETNQRTVEVPFVTKNVFVVFDMKRSGCQITWDYFFPCDATDRPWFVDYVADRDLWKWEIPMSRQVNCCLMEENIIDASDLSKLTNLLTTTDSKEQFITKGTIYCDIYDKEVANACKYATEAIMKVGENTYRVWVSTITSKLRSELGNVLTKKKFADGVLPDFGVYYSYHFETNQFHISLRGGDTSTLNLTKIAEHFGGGGHPKACGFAIDCNEMTMEGKPKSLRDVFVPVTQK
jgi:oligoribonuclease NrnB/cAMP/cGMP phosphodiesterase (DHH superfamily)